MTNKAIYLATLLCIPAAALIANAPAATAATYPSLHRKRNTRWRSAVRRYGRRRPLGLHPPAELNFDWLVCCKLSAKTTTDYLSRTGPFRRCASIAVNTASSELSRRSWVNSVGATSSSRPDSQRTASR